MGEDERKVTPSQKESAANQEMYRLAREGKRYSKEYNQEWRKAVEAGKAKNNE